MPMKEASNDERNNRVCALYKTSKYGRDLQSQPEIQA